MNLGNKQWMWKNWQQVYFGAAVILVLPLIVMFALSVKGPLFTLAGVAGALSLAILCYVLFAADSVNKKYIKEILESDLLKFTYSNNLNGLKNLNLSTVELNYEMPEGHCLLTIASASGFEEMVQYFISKKVLPQKNLNPQLHHPLHIAALSGHVEIVKKLLVYFQSLKGADFKVSTLSQFQINCFLGNREEVLKETKEFAVHEKDFFGQSALFYALRGKADELIVLHLLKLKAHINSKGRILAEDDFKNRTLKFDDVIVSHFAFGRVGEEVLLEMLTREKQYEVDAAGKTVFMHAAFHGHLNILNKIKDYVDVLKKDANGNDAISYAKMGKQVEAEKLIRSIIESAEKKKKEEDSKKRSQSIAMGAQINPNEKVVIQFEDLQLMITSTLRGMVSVDSFISAFCYDLKSFMDKKNGSLGIVLWGNSAVGKTEISRRLSGTYKDHVAKFSLPGVDVQYIACCDTNIDVKKIIDGISKKTVLFLDEIDKYLSPSSGIVSESQAKGLRTSFLTNFESKDIFWVFTGTFADIRGDKKLNREILEKTLGQELASRLDFVDYMLPDWNIQSLLTASRNVLAKDTNVEYDNEAIMVLVDYILKSQGGVRSLEKSHEAFKRRLRKELSSGEKVVITTDHVNEYISRENEQ